MTNHGSGSYDQSNTSLAHDRLTAYAKKVATALVKAGHEPPEQWERWKELEHRGLFRKKSVLVPYRRSMGKAWEVYRTKKMFLMQHIDQRRAGPGECVGFLMQEGHVVIWLRRDGTLDVLEEWETSRSGVPDWIDVRYGEYDGSDGDALGLPDFFIDTRRDRRREKTTGYYEWHEWKRVRRLHHQFGVGLSMALKHLASSHGIEFAPRQRG